MKKLYVTLFIILNISLQVFCTPTNEPCGIEDPINNLPWLQTYIDSVELLVEYIGCNCNDMIAQYCFNNQVYFDTSPIERSCIDYPSFVYDVDGNLICSKGGFAGGNCSSEFYNLTRDAEFLGVVWSCNENCGCPETRFSPVCGSDGNVYRNECYATCENIAVEKAGPCDESLCTDFTFTNTSIRCEPDCGDFLEFELIGGDGNYTVVNTSIIVNNGDPVFSSPDNNAYLTAIDGNGCTTEINIPAGPCGESPSLSIYRGPECLGNNLFTVGVQIRGNEGNYQLNSIGEAVVGSPGEVLFITLSTKTYMERVEMVYLENGCIINARLQLENPNCPSAIPPQTGIFNCE